MMRKTVVEVPFEPIELEFLDALANIQAGTPTNKELQRKARSGTLKVSVAIVAKEAGRSRTLIGLDKCAYPRVRRLIREAMAIPEEPPTSFEEVNRNLRQRNRELEAALKIALSRAVALARKVTETNKQAEKKVAEAYRRCGLDRNGKPRAENSTEPRYGNVTGIRTKQVSKAPFTD